MNDENIAQKESFEEAQVILIERENQFERSYSEQEVIKNKDLIGSKWEVEVMNGIF